MAKCYAESLVQRVTAIASFVVVFSVAARGLQGCPLEAGVRTSALPSARDVVIDDGSTSDPGPAHSKASQESDQREIAVAWKSVPVQAAIVPNGVVLPPLGLTAALGRQIAPFRASAASASCSVRAPPVAV